MKKETKKKLQKLEVITALGGSVVLSAFVFTPLGFVTAGAWGYWRYKRWRKRLRQEVLKQRNYTDNDDLIKRL